MGGPGTSTAAAPFQVRLRSNSQGGLSRAQRSGGGIDLPGRRSSKKKVIFEGVGGPRGCLPWFSGLATAQSGPLPGNCRARIDVGVIADRHCAIRYRSETQSNRRHQKGWFAMGRSIKVEEERNNIMGSTLTRTGPRRTRPCFPSLPLHHNRRMVMYTDRAWRLGGSSTAKKVISDPPTNRKSGGTNGQPRFASRFHIPKTQSVRAPMGSCCRWSGGSDLFASLMDPLLTPVVVHLPVRR